MNCSDFSALVSVLLLTAASADHSKDEEPACRTPGLFSEPGFCVDKTRCSLIQKFERRSKCGHGHGVCCPRGQISQPINVQPDVDDFPPNFPSPERGCGVSDSLHMRIVGGSEAALGAWPWIVLYGYRVESSEDNKLQWLCGGTLITDRHTVTAAHCTEPPGDMIVARLGELNLDHYIDKANPVDILIAEVIVHPRYSDTKYTDDIAIVTLHNPVSFTSNISPICLPFNLRNKTFLSYHPFVAGWGATQYDGTSSKALMEAQIKVVDNKSCGKDYKRFRFVITERQLCAGGGSDRKDACTGDSGGPLMLPWKSGEKGHLFYLIGVVSYGYKCAEPGYPGVYARVTEYLDWIVQNVNSQ